MTRVILFVLCFAACSAAQQPRSDGWISLFDGKSLDGWKASENAATWTVVDGTLATDGPRSHLFYVGPVKNADFRNFELKADVLTKPLANSGMYFHTTYQEKGFPAKGFEVQVNNTARGKSGYRERKKTSSLYGVRNVYKQLVKDDEWFQMHIVVRGKQVQVRVNGTLTMDFVEPEPPELASDRGRYLDHGTFALQGHDPQSKVYYKNIMVKPLPDNTEGSGPPPVVDETYRDLLRLGADNYLLVDHHVHVRNWPLEDALAHSRKTGINLGVAVNCGLNFPVKDDAGAEKFIASLKGQPVFVAMQAEGREWVKMFSPATVAKFDYVFSDAMTFTDDAGKRMRLWIKEEVGEIADPQAFMDMYVKRIVGVLNDEPIDIYANPTFLPDQIAANYDQLWTPERMKAVIDAAVKNEVAIEINNRYRLPSAAFIKQAKEAGAKFACGTNNASSDLGRIEHCIAMIKEAKLRAPDFFEVRPDGEKPIQRKGFRR